MSPQPTPRAVVPQVPNPLPNPVSLGQGEKANRNLYCGQYSACLDLAIHEGWTDWTCSKCALNVEVKGPGAVQWAQSRIRHD